MGEEIEALRAAGHDVRLFINLSAQLLNDAAIIAAAHKSTRGGNEQAQVNRARPPQRSWLTRWQPLAAAAAVAGLAFVLVQSLPRDHDVATSPRMEERATTPAAQEHPASPATREAIEAKTAGPPATTVARESVTAPAVAIDRKSEAEPVMTLNTPGGMPARCASSAMASAE